MFKEFGSILVVDDSFNKIIDFNSFVEGIETEYNHKISNQIYFQENLDNGWEYTVDPLNGQVKIIYLTEVVYRILYARTINGTTDSQLWRVIYV